MVAALTASNVAAVWIPITSAGVSVLALVLSAVSLWRSHLAPQKIVTSAGPMTMCIHRMKSASGETWLLPHFAVAVSFTNSGAQIGRVNAIRAVVRYPSLPIPDAREVFTCHGEYDQAKYRQHGDRRFAMIEEALLGDFVPLVVLPRSTTTHFYVFDSRWDRPVRQRDIAVAVEIQTEKSATWRQVDTWEYRLQSDQHWKSLENGSRHSTQPTKSQHNHRYRHPDDLHDHTHDDAVGDDRPEVTHSVTEITGDPAEDRTDP